MEGSLIIVLNNSGEAKRSAVLAHHDALAGEAAGCLVEGAVRLSQQGPAMAKSSLFKDAIPAESCENVLECMSEEFFP